MKNSTRLAQFYSEIIEKGPLYAIANYRIHSPIPLDANENWNFWNSPKPSWLESWFRSYPSESKRKAYLDSILKQDHSDGIEAHYDVSNEFYALFLDTKYRFYTCAEFVSDRESLEEAQTHKAEYLRQLLNLQGDEQILDLGCGWGAMLKFLQDSGHRGKLSGLTLSKEQATYDREQLGLNVSLKNFITEPFTADSYERIFSIGSLEHVKPQELEKVYQKIYDALGTEGVAVHQFFSSESGSYPISAISLQLFFPGSILSPHQEHLDAAQHAGFRITHDSIHDYQPTIRAWYDRLAANQERALDLVGLEIYNRYITFFAFAWLFFQQNEAKLHRMVMQKA